jgi:hypothetical protein
MHCKTASNVITTAKKFYYSPLVLKSHTQTHTTTNNTLKPETGKKYSNGMIHQLNIDTGMTNSLQMASDNFNDYFSDNSK